MIGMITVFYGFFRYILLGIVSVFVTLPAFAYTDLEACYGEQLEVSMPTLVEEDGSVTERTKFALPSPKAWYIESNVAGEYKLLQDLPCLEEPIKAWIARGGFIEPRIGHGDFKLPVEGVRFQTISLSSPDTKAAERDEKFWFDLIMSKGARTDDGFMRSRGENKNAVGGSWLFPEAYLSPIGTRIKMGCALVVCKIEYRLTHNFKLRYHFFVKDKMKAPPWVEIDTYVRETVMSWIID